jgi:hypothetical protein
VPLLVLAQELDPQVAQDQLLDNRKLVTKTIPELQGIDRKVAVVLFPHISVNWELVVQGAVVAAIDFQCGTLGPARL